MTSRVVAMVFMFLAAWGGYWLKPKVLLADQLPSMDLERMVPKQLGNWHAIDNTVVQVINPQNQTLVNTLYQHVLNRVYTNTEGYTVMLSVAYGRNQRDGLDVHKPEVCYPAQGFQLKELQHVELMLPGRVVPATQLLTKMGPRVEPVTYWLVLADEFVTSGVDKKLKEMRHGIFDRVVPDGMLVRLSSIDNQSVRAFQMQKHFANAFLSATQPEHQSRIFGRLLP